MARLATKALAAVLLLGVANARMVVNEEALAAAECPDADNGVAAAAIIDSKDPRYAQFKEVSDNLQKWMNISINPCDDFYGYTCETGQKNKVTGPFSVSESADITVQIDAYKDDAYFRNAALPLKQLQHAFNTCWKPDATQAQVTASLKKKFDALKKETGVNFPMLYQTERPTALNAATLATLIGYPIADSASPSLVTVSVDQDYKQPDDVPARVYVDQSFPMYTSVVYDDWATYKPQIVTSIVAEMEQLASRFGLRISLPALRSDASAVAEMEYALRNYRTDDTTRRQVARSYNLQTVQQLQSSAPGYNWITLLQTALKRANSPEKIVNSLQVVVKEPDQIVKLAKDIAARKAPFDVATVANYVYFRAASNIVGTAPPNKLVENPELVEEEAVQVPNIDHLKRKYNPRTGGPRIIKGPRREEVVALVTAGLITQKQLDCFEFVKTVLPRAADRVFVDKTYTTADSRTEIRREVTAVAQSIFNGFRTQLNMLNWMSDDSKQGAYKKIENLLLNIAYPEWVLDDAQLTAYYKGLTFTTSASTIDTYDSLYNYFLTDSVDKFRTNAPRDRGDFGSSVGTTNAFYSPTQNAIIYPAGILHAPFYHPNYPAAVNFGSLGSVSGHELTHGFDDEGVQWDYIGSLNAWLDEGSAAEFTKMANCVVNEYSAFCPYPDTCLNGANTQGENIADNGGMQAAYKAFKSTESYYGPDPRLPGFGSKFTNDQLFFLSFGSVWCDAVETQKQYEQQIEVDPHAPAYYRVLGTIQNFPAFRTAFNCPVGSTYAPKDHCNVWTSPPK